MFDFKLPMWTLIPGFAFGSGMIYLIENSQHTLFALTPAGWLGANLLVAGIVLSSDFILTKLKKE